MTCTYSLEIAKLKWLWIKRLRQRGEDTKEQIMSKKEDGKTASGRAQKELLFHSAVFFLASDGHTIEDRGE